MILTITKEYQVITTLSLHAVCYQIFPLITTRCLRECQSSGHERNRWYRRTKPINREKWKKGEKDERCVPPRRLTIDTAGPSNLHGIFKKADGRSVYEASCYDSSEADIDDVGHQRRSCARACRQQCTPPVPFEHITMDHVGEMRLMISGWDVPRTQPVVPPRRLHAPPSWPPFRTPLDTVRPPPLVNCGTVKERPVLHTTPGSQLSPTRREQPFAPTRLVE